MSTGILARRSEIARETIQKELQKENFHSLIQAVNPRAHPKDKVINLICHKILEKIRVALDNDRELSQQLEGCQKTLSHPESVFYTDVEKRVGREIKKLDIQFSTLPAPFTPAKRAVYPRINSVCSKIFDFFKF